jgi:ERI1 exoribonuclease 3
MMTMMRQLEMSIFGSHHLGIDDSKNIARVVQRMLADGAVIKITANRQSAAGDVKFLFENRIR